MSRIEIRGVIVSSDFDNEMWSAEIEKGIITPESRVRGQLSEASRIEPLEIYINSVGGSVFAGHEMMNAIVDWKEETKQEVNVTIGSIAASAASSIALHLGPVTAHENTEFMFHSAQSMAQGGPQSMGDTMTLLDQINAMDVKCLVNKYTADMSVVQEWFSEGRMGWMDANEAAGIGLVKKIIPSAGQAIDFGELDIISMDSPDAMDIAAFIEVELKTEEEDETMADRIQMLENEKQELTVQVDDLAKELEQALADAKQSAEAAYDEGMAAGHAAGSAEAANACKAEVEEAQAKAVELEAKIAELEQSLEAAEAAKAEAEARAEELSAGFKTPESDEGPTGDYMEMVEQRVADGASMDAAMIAVQREFPELHKAFIAKANK